MPSAVHPQKISAPDLLEFYGEVRRRTEKLCRPLETEDYVPQPIVDVSPPKWHIAHTTWFFEEMILKKFAPEYQVFDENFAFLFNSYYNTLGERVLRHKRGDLSRPTVKQIFAYRKYVDEQMENFLRADLSSAVKDLVILGLNHEQQHQELFLTDLKYIFGCNPLFPVYDAAEILEEKVEHAASARDSFIERQGGICEIGYEGEGFCFDNELARHKVYLNDFSIAGNLVTNAEFIEFIEDGGYRNFNLWHSEGWDWINQTGVSAPLYWSEKDGEWFQFTLGGLRQLNPRAPVCHVSFYEAAAFAEWRGMRLPTEFEWEAAASDKFDWGLRWEWTNSAYLPYPNSKYGTKI
jgi:ergothioneine biosynthesis protein EgtB